VLSEKAHSFRHSTDVIRQNISYASRQNLLVRAGINRTRKFQMEFDIGNWHVHCFSLSKLEVSGNFLEESKLWTLTSFGPLKSMLVCPAH